MTESRYDRQERIWWWDQARLEQAHVLVVGAGALGNEIVKNLALVGVGSVDVVDMDVIEHSNLARCALFRESDEGRPKAVVLAEAAREVNPTVSLRSFPVPVQELGTSWIGQYDAIIAGLDSREARLWVNLACRRMGKPWIDGAIEGLQGLVRMFDTQGPCYDCSLSESERLAISHRRSCALLSPEQIVEGKTPTNATSASLVAALQVQEAIKQIVGRRDLLALLGKVWRIEGETMTAYTMEYVEDPDCISHERLEEWIDGPAAGGTLSDVVEVVSQHTGQEVDAIFFLDDVMVIEPCATCRGEDRFIGLRPLVPSGGGRCAQCSSDRPIRSFTSIEVADPLISTPWEQWRWPRLEPIVVRSGERYLHVNRSGDSAPVIRAVTKEH